VSPNSQDILNLFYPAATAAYVCQDPSQLALGNRFAFSSQIVVDAQKASHTVPQYMPTLAGMLKLSPILGFIAKGPGSVLVSFRGTEVPGEWLCDLEAVPTTYHRGSGTVHEGFQKIYGAIRDSALDAAKSAFDPGDQTLITGHSLGAALAILFADEVVDLTQNLQVCTFAGPRTGLADFAASHNRRVPNTVRIVNRWDIVPKVPIPVPPLCLYEHVGSAVPIDGGFTLDLRHAHSLPLSYLPGLNLKREVGAYAG